MCCPCSLLLEEVAPDVVSVALDPEASGPDTHYKVLQAVTEALRRYERQRGDAPIKVWGYRNVWYRFDPSEANIFVPVSLNMLSVMQSAFMSNFIFSARRFVSQLRTRRPVLRAGAPSAGGAVSENQNVPRPRVVSRASESP